MRIFNYNDWEWSRIRRDEKDGDVIGNCINCGQKIDLCDGAIYDCYRCGIVLRKEEEGGNCDGIDI